MQRNQESLILRKFKENGGICELEALLLHGISPWELKKIMKSIRLSGYRVSSDRLWLDIEYRWMDWPNNW